MKKQKKITILIIATIIVIGIVFLGLYVYDYNKKSLRIANPSAIYCYKLGYESKINETSKGQVGICIFPDGSECSAWSFYRGQCGQNWSYCALNGYDIETKDDGKDPYSITYSVCVDKDTKQEVGLVSELINLEESLPSTLKK